MDPSVLRLLWAVIEETEPRFILRLQDDNLANWLTEEMQKQQFLLRGDVLAARRYIEAKVAMIRDIAQAKLDERP